MTRTVDDGVYVLRNKATRTYLHLNGGGSANGTTIIGWDQLPDGATYYNQNWLIQYNRENEAYTFRNVRGGTFLDLVRGGAANGNGMAVHGLSKSREPRNDTDQLWLIEGPAADETYRIDNRGTKASLEIGNSNASNGAGVNTWASVDVANQAWFLERRDRHGFHIEELLSENPFVKQQFRPFKTNVPYIICPRKALEDLCEKRGILRKKDTDEIYDCDDRAYSLKAAVGEWARENVKVKVAVVFGIMYGTLIGGNQDARYVYNWTPTHDWNSIVFFEAETGRFLENVGYQAYHCLV